MWTIFMTFDEKAFYELHGIEAIRIGLASLEMIAVVAREVKKPRRINYRTLKPSVGLFAKGYRTDQDWECHCGKYKKTVQR